MKLLVNLNVLSKHGDPVVADFIANTLRSTTLPIIDMIFQWVSRGQLEDPFRDFFVISTDNSHFTKNQTASWSTIYLFDANKIPYFVSVELAKTIFLTGKTLNFIRFCCDGELFVKEFCLKYHRGSL